MGLRTCLNTKGRGCLRTLPEGDFPRRGLIRDGTVRRDLLCKPCAAEVQAEWEQANPEKHRAIRRRTYAAHREKVLRAVSVYEKANRERINARRRERAARTRAAQ